MQCRGEHDELGHHEHSHHDHDHDHDHDHNEGDGGQDSLYPYIDTSKLRCLNAERPEWVGHPFKPYADRLDRTKYLESNEDDPEFILFIPFTQAVTIRSICISGGEDGKHPKNIKVFANRDDIDFTNAQEIPAQQRLELVEDPTASIDYPLQQRKFQSVSNITIFVEDSFNEEQTRFYYIGLKGENKEWKHGVVECVYEARANAADHKIPDTQGSLANP